MLITADRRKEAVPDPSKIEVPSTWNNLEPPTHILIVEIAKPQKQTPISPKPETRIRRHRNRKHHLCETFCKL